MNWKYYYPKFEYEEKFQDVAWPWAGHKFFAYDLIRNMKPKRVVELGTHMGTSFFSFCQAVKDEGSMTEINAVDTWKGDKHTGNYNETIWQEVNEIKKLFYVDLRANLLRMTFDEALSKFERASVDLLHIDGLHTYEAVKHDFDIWFDVIKDDGVILFHDIEVGEKDFGVYKLWDELKGTYPTIEFFHSFGLGVLFKNKDAGDYLVRIQKELQMHYSYLHEERKNSAINGLIESVNIKNQELQQKDQVLRQKDQELQQKDQEIQFMKSSKFWKMRDIYMKIRTDLNLNK